MSNLDDGRRNREPKHNDDNNFDLARLPPKHAQEVRDYYEKYVTFLKQAGTFLLPLLANDACRRGFRESNVPITLEEFVETMLAKPRNSPESRELRGILDRGFQTEYSEAERAKCERRLRPLIEG